MVAGAKDGELGFRVFRPSALTLPLAPYRVVEHVEDSSWASRVGVQTGDYLLTVHRREVAEVSSEQLASFFTGPRPLRLTFSRLKRFTATLTEREQTGLKTSSIPPAAFVQIGKVEPGTWAHQAEIFVGDALVAVNRICLDSMSRREFIRQMKEERPLSLTIDRNHGANSVTQFERFTVMAGHNLSDSVPTRAVCQLRVLQSSRSLRRGRSPPWLAPLKHAACALLARGACGGCRQDSAFSQAAPACSIALLGRLGGSKSNHGG